MSKSLDDIFDNDDFGLLDTSPVRSYIQTDEDRLIESFEEINMFYEKHSREPSTASMSEYSLQAKLKAFRDNQKNKEMLKSFDRFNLLGEVEQKKLSIDDVLENDNLNLLGDDGDHSIYNFIHTPKPGSRADAEYIAQRKSMSEREFKKYESMFQQVHRELKEGKRKLLPFNDAERNLLEGNFYLVDGLLAYLEVSDAEKVLKENESGNRVRLEGRTLTIFENGTVSNMLFRSLGKAIQKNGKMITNTEEHVEKELFKNSGLDTDSEENIQSGWIYVLKSKSNNPQIQKLDNLYKIGFSRTPVEKRVKNASKEATYLYSDVQTIATYNCENINVQALENLLQRFFTEACLNIDVHDKQGNRYAPREWFVVPLQNIDEAIQLVQNETITHYRYDSESEKIVLR